MALRTEVLRDRSVQEFELCKSVTITFAEAALKLTAECEARFAITDARIRTLREHT